MLPGLAEPVYQSLSAGWRRITTIWRWVQRYGPELEQRLRRHLKPTNKSWRVPRIRVAGRPSFAALIIQLAGKSIMLGFKVSQATVSRYMPPPYVHDGVNRGGHFCAISCRRFRPVRADGEEDPCSPIFFEHNGLPRSIAPRIGSSLTRSRVLWSGRPHARIYRLATRPGRPMSTLSSCHSNNTTRRNPQTEARASPRDHQSNLDQVSILLGRGFEKGQLAP